MKIIPVGKARKGSFLCKICRHYRPKKDMTYLGAKHIKVCSNCLEEIDDANRKKKRVG